jgi:transcriptional regulator with XRE-family HTH domain
MLRLSTMRRSEMGVSFGQLLRSLREEKEKTMGQLARHLGVSVPYISDVEHDNRAPLTRERILAAAEFLGVDPKQLLVAAAAGRGAFELDANVGGRKQKEVGAALMRSWPELSDDELSAIARVLGKRGEKGDP